MREHEVLIDDKRIADLVEQFYAKARYDPLLGPIFAHAVGDEWDAHLATMRSFWSTVVMGTATYKGNPMIEHMRLGGLGPQHFERWLELWRTTAQEVCGEEGSIFVQRAEAMAGRLLAAVSGTLPSSPFRFA